MYGPALPKKKMWVHGSVLPAAMGVRLGPAHGTDAGDMGVWLGPAQTHTTAHYMEDDMAKRKSGYTARSYLQPWVYGSALPKA